MALLLNFIINKTFSPLPIIIYSLFFALCSLPLLVSPLSTITISETANQTIICALIHSSTTQQSNPPSLNCTTFPQGNQIPIRPGSSGFSFSALVAGNGFVCALMTSPSSTSSSSTIIRCWRFSVNGANMTVNPYKRIYDGGPLKELVAGNSHICGLMVENRNSLECWQWTRFKSSPSEFRNQNFTSMAVGENFVCGILELGNIKCLEQQNNGGFDSTIRGGGNYSVIAAGFHRVCAISLNGSLECWTDQMVDGAAPQGKFEALALGENRNCAMRTSGTVVCWGENNFSLPESLRNKSFIAIESKRNVFCGVERSDYSLYCWGNEFLDPNSKVFENVVPGPCTSACPCSRPLPGYGSYCSQGQMICEPCEIQSQPQITVPFPFSPPPPPTPCQETRSNGGWNNQKMVAFIVVGCVGSVSLAITSCFLFSKRCKVGGSRVHDSGPLDEEATAPPPHRSDQEAPAPAPAPPVLEKRLSKLISLGNGGGGTGHLEEFTLESLHQATNKFSDEHKIGTGSFGSVYQATLDDGREVALKRAETSTSSSQVRQEIHHNQDEEDKDNAFLNELEFLSRLNHKNLVRLLGYCEDNNERILVYEYVNNGSLHDHLHHNNNNKLKSISSSPLLSSWATRIKVAVDAARGIEYLHVYAVPPIIHRDIKSSNILLDDKWTAKVSDFGLSLMGPKDDESHLSLRAAGTVGYMDPEYFRFQQLTPKSDVYSFGVVLLELLSGYRAIHRNENGVPRNVVDFVVPYIVQDEIHRILDPNVPPPTPYEIEAVAYVGYLAADCVTLQGRDRPNITEIVNCLERALTACVQPPLPPPPPSSLSRSSTGSSM